MCQFLVVYLPLLKGWIEIWWTSLVLLKCSFENHKAAVSGQLWYSYSVYTVYNDSEGCKYRLTKYININCCIFTYTICQWFHQNSTLARFIPNFECFNSRFCIISAERNNFLSNNMSPSLQVEHYFLLKSIFHLQLNFSNHFVLQKIFPIKDDVCSVYS